MADRRRFLRAVAVGVGAGIAGCSDGSSGNTTADSGDSSGDGGGSSGDGMDLGVSNDADGSDGDSGGGGRSTATARSTEFPSLSGGKPTYRRWVAAEGEGAIALWNATNLGRYRERRDWIPAGTFEDATSYVTAVGYFGVPFSELDGIVTAVGGPGIVFPGEFDRGAIRDALAKTGYGEYETRGDVTFYRGPAAEQAQQFAVSDRGVITSFGGRGDEFLDQSVQVFETAAGERTRRYEAVDRFRQYVDAVGWPLDASAVMPARNAGGVRGVVPESIETSVAVGRTRHVADGAMVERSWVWPLEDGDATPDDVESALRGYDFPGAEGDDRVALRRSGRVTEAAIVRPVENAGGGADPLQFTVEAARSDGNVVLEHLAGDPLPLDRITVRAGGETYAVEGTLEAGGSVTVDAVPADPGRVVFIYAVPHGDSKTTVAEIDES